MTRLDGANVIRLFEFYLASMLVVGLARRYPVYLDTIRLVAAMPGRYPKLLLEVRRHGALLATAGVLRPLGLATALTATQFLVSRLIYPSAAITVAEVRDSLGMSVLLVAAAIPMLLVDGYFLVRVGRFDRASTEGYLATAEGWLSGWRATAVRVATLGYFDPRRIVGAEVAKAVSALGGLVGWSAWWVAAQVACRLACGLTIWGAWLVSRGS